MPIYTMGVYLLNKQVHHQMDTIRSQFFWRGDVEKFKYHMVKWEHACLPKDFGGLGILNTRLLNVALLLKWVWRLYNGEANDPCCQLLKAKYLCRCTFALAKNRQGSQFWKGLLKIKDKFKWGATFKLGNGKDILFWEDTWVGKVPLRLLFPKLYGYCTNNKTTVDEYFDSGEWKIDFCRSLD